MIFSKKFFEIQNFEYDFNTFLWFHCKLLSSESGDGTKLSETGGLTVVKGKTGATKQGSVSWTSPEGQRFRYLLNPVLLHI